MKVRWKEHEMIFAAILTSWQIIILLLNVYGHSIEELQADFVIQFKESGIPFTYWKNVLLPQISLILLMFFTYLLINLFVLPSIKRISGDDIERLLSIRIARAIFSVILASYLLAIGINVISFFARPDLFNYGGYRFLSIGGYNDKPLTNLFAGFGGALGVVVLFTSLAGLRDLIIWLIEQPGTKREFRVLITNNTTPLLFLYFLLLFISNPLHDDFVRYVVFVTPLLALYLYLTFWLFPLKGEKTFLDKSVSLRLLLATFICAMPSLVLFFGHSRGIVPVFYWAFVLFIATPVFWIIYQQRKDKILQLKNMETALAKTDANLQLLKSQINPHFLFNALNSLYGTALKGESDKTAEGIQKLGDMMRFMLHENTLDLIPMHKEIEYLKNFISMQKLRIESSSNIIIEDDLEETPCKNRIAPMLLIPFVENAFKHGISLTEKSWIKIDLTCKDNIIDFEVKNSIHTHSNDVESGKSGIGLSNVKGRLKLQYPDKHILDIKETEREFIAKLILKC
jgi:two-component system, LytTR family, sensor kinase